MDNAEQAKEVLKRFKTRDKDRTEVTTAKQRINIYKASDIQHSKKTKIQNSDQIWNLIPILHSFMKLKRSITTISVITYSAK